MGHKDCVSRLWWVLGHRSINVVSRHISSTILYRGVIGSYTRKMTIKRILRVINISALCRNLRRIFTLIAIFHLKWLFNGHVGIRIINHIGWKVHVFWFSLGVDECRIALMILNFIQILKLDFFSLILSLTLHSLCSYLFSGVILISLLIFSFLLTEYLWTQRLNFKSLVHFMMVSRGIILIILLSRQLIPKSFKVLFLTILVCVITVKVVDILLGLVS